MVQGHSKYRWLRAPATITTCNERSPRRSSEGAEAGDLFVCTVAPSSDRQSHCRCDLGAGKRGVSNPRGRARDGGRSNRGVAHAPAPLRTLAEQGVARQSAPRVRVAAAHYNCTVPITCPLVSGISGRTGNAFPASLSGRFADANHAGLSGPPSRRQQFANHGVSELHF